MTNEKRTRITVETERLLLIRRRQSLFAVCKACGDEVRLVNVEDASAVAGVSALSIYRLVESGTLHHAETASGELLVCAESLGNLLWSRRPLDSVS
jgi:hypothetical protein